MTDIRSLMQQYGATESAMCLRFKPHVTRELIREWQAGTKRPPPYAELSFKALQRNLEPVTPATMQRHNLVELIGAAQANVTYWRKNNAFPIMARYALAFKLYELNPIITPADKSIILRIWEYRYYGIGLWYSVRPVPGKRTPARITRLKVERLVHMGYLQITPANEVRLTAKGRTCVPRRD